MEYTQTTQTNVIAATFENGDAAYGALAELKQLDADGALDLHGAAVVTRDETGQMVTKDGVEREPIGIATGGIVGLLIGILGGPLGMLIGGTSGLLFGSLFDLDEAIEDESVLTELSHAVVPGKDTLLFEVEEDGDHAAVDRVLSSRAAIVLRRDVADVEAEIAAAETARHEASREARKRLRDERLQRSRTQVEARIADMKAKLPASRGKAAGGEQHDADAQVAASA
jgi:uncharacterized membrane protein